MKYILTAVFETKNEDDAIFALQHVADNLSEMFGEQLQISHVLWRMKTPAPRCAPCKPFAPKMSLPRGQLPAKTMLLSTSCLPKAAQTSSRIFSAIS